MPDADHADHLQQDSKLLFDAVREAGALGLTMFRQNVRSWSKPDGSILTEADLAINKCLQLRLEGNRPSYGWLSEENPDTPARLSCRSIWIVDPIDGTRAFAERRDEWCVTAALITDGQPVAAAVYRPMTEDFYSAIKGGGCFLNGNAVRAADGDSLAGAEIIGTRKSLQAVVASGIIPGHNLQIPLLLRLAMVAAGQVAGAMSVGHKNDWDLAAGALLVQEGFGQVSDFSGARMNFNRADAFQDGMVAAGRNRHHLIMEHLKSS